ncbi:MAG: hypothetical protein H6905_01835 [Hyphomicrobiales bacterium]|nr:hypothetical protein [Hyphomicrobiales bacterium]
MDINQPTNTGQTTLLSAVTGKQTTENTAPQIGADGTYNTSSSTRPTGEGLSLTPGHKAELSEAFRNGGDAGVKAWWQKFHQVRAEQAAQAPAQGEAPNDIEGVAAEAPVGSIEYMAQQINVDPTSLQEANSVIEQQFGKEAGFTAYTLGEIGSMCAQATDDMIAMHDAGILNETLDKGEQAVFGLYRNEADLNEAVGMVKEAAGLLFGDKAEEMLEGLAISGAFDYSPTAHQRIVSIARQVVAANSRKGGF